MSHEDAALVRRLREAGVLMPFDEGQIDFSEGAMGFFCGDGRHFHDKYRYIAGAAERQRKDYPNIFVASFAGGPLVVDPASPINLVVNHTPVVECNLDLAQRLGYRHFIMHAHYACQMGQDYGLTLLQNIYWAVRGKQHIKRTRPVSKVYCLFHGFFPDESRRTYHLSAQAWDAWMHATSFEEPAANFGY